MKTTDDMAFRQLALIIHSQGGGFIIAYLIYHYGKTRFKSELKEGLKLHVDKRLGVWKL